jgi:transcriptional regulator with XRE-family HTH domain
MTPTQRKLPRKRGRKALTVEDKDAAEAQRRTDGARLNAALQRLKLSQAKAARLSGIRQQWLNGIVNGSRAIGREDLRALASTHNISADYLLGVPGALMFVGEEFNQGLEKALAERVAQKAVTGSIVPEHWIREELSSLIDGKAILAKLMQLVQEDVLMAVSYLRRLDLLSSNVTQALDVPDQHTLDAIFEALSPVLDITPQTTILDVSRVRLSAGLWEYFEDRSEAKEADRSKKRK